MSVLKIVFFPNCREEGLLSLCGAIVKRKHPTNQKLNSQTERQFAKKILGFTLFSSFYQKKN